jgi:hypothetical protein
VVNSYHSTCKKDFFVYNAKEILSLHGLESSSSKAIMKHFSVLFSLLALFVASSCTPKEEEQEPDYENMVMADEEDEWTSGQEQDGKAIAGDLEPQEFLIQDPELKTENCLETLP